MEDLDEALWALWRSMLGEDGLLLHTASSGLRFEVNPVECQVGFIVSRPPVRNPRPEDQGLPLGYDEGTGFVGDMQGARSHKDQLILWHGALQVPSEARR